MSELETMSHAAFIALLRGTDPAETWPGHMMDEAADRIGALEAERDRLREFAAWVDTWVSNPVGAYSVSALDGLFGMARDRLGAIDAARRALDGSEG